MYLIGHSYQTIYAESFVIVKKPLHANGVRSNRATAKRMGKTVLSAAINKGCGQNEITVLEFYAGIGGMHAGLKRAEQAGLIPNAEVLSAFDINPVANQVYAHNYGQSLVRCVRRFNRFTDVCFQCMYMYTRHDDQESAWCTKYNGSWEYPSGLLADHIEGVLYHHCLPFKVTMVRAQKMDPMIAHPDSGGIAYEETLVVAEQYWKGSYKSAGSV
jgi:hypothetical protein